MRARARAILRGLEIARNDLKQAGGAFTLDEVRALLGGVSRQRVDQLVKQGKLLAVPGPNNARCYPTVQFNDDGCLIKGLADVLEKLPTRNSWAILCFLIHADPQLGGVSPLDMLRRDQIATAVAAAARMGEAGA